ncbi:hypothetical protein [Legionella feeleii]|uniref:Uncharacterized protein n=1 Tax=Legionella feeleii TaxID=453 RepID=A0A378J6A1_9GAMM|nr:hypothetical protein [Legionella feeleii]STX39804.1 Uncharacterised protein [Legionella feeleii]
MPKSIGTLFTESRLIAKTINRITVETDHVDLQDWRTEAKLLASPGGSCLSSTTLLVKGKHVPTYGIDGRCYGFLFNVEECNIYDVSSTDSNSNRISKLAKRTERKGVDMLTSNTVGAKTLDELAAEVKGGRDGQINEIMLDAWKKSCVGLFVRRIDLDKASPEGLKHYYQSLLEISLIQKYLVQAFDYPEDFKICQYEEQTGRLLTTPSLQDIKTQARLYGITDRTQPELFRLLDDSHHFSPLPKPVTVGAFLDAYSDFDISLLRDEIIAALVKGFEPFDARPVDESSILLEPVDGIVGISESTILETIEHCVEMQRLSTSTQALSLGSGMFSGRPESGSTSLECEKEIALTPSSRD